MRVHIEQAVTVKAFEGFPATVYRKRQTAKRAARSYAIRLIEMRGYDSWR